MAALNDIEFGGRKADFHYSIPKEGDPPEKAQVRRCCLRVGDADGPSDGLVGPHCQPHVV